MQRLRSSFNISNTAYTQPERRESLQYMTERDKAYTMTCAPSEDSDQPAHRRIPIRVFAVGVKKLWVIGYP